MLGTSVARDPASLGWINVQGMFSGDFPKAESPLTGEPRSDAGRNPALPGVKPKGHRH